MTNMLNSQHIELVTELWFTGLMKPLGHITNCPYHTMANIELCIYGVTVPP